MNSQTSLLNQKFESATMIKMKAQEYAKSKGFAVVTESSNMRSLVLRCRHSGIPRNYSKLSDVDKPEANKRKAERISMLFEVVDTHSHTIDRYPLIYHQHRKLDDDDHQKLQEYVAAKARNIVIYEALRDTQSRDKAIDEGE
ncbi:hypothetical protein Unana1_06359 [Umbelopsis nana]